MLDEALASLADGDRRALMLRFYEGRSFKIIAILSGKSEAACQKQARRAIDKLSALLQRRGVALPSTTLVAGLTAILTKTAPAEVVVSITHRALGQSVAAGVSTTLIPHLTLMNTKTALTVGAAILIACAGSRYFAGVAAKQNEGDGGVLQPDDNPGGSAAEIVTPGGLQGESNRASRNSLQQLLRLAREEFQRGDEIGMLTRIQDGGMSEHLQATPAGIIHQEEGHPITLGEASGRDELSIAAIVGKGELPWSEDSEKPDRAAAMLHVGPAILGDGGWAIPGLENSMSASWRRPTVIC